MDIDEKAQQAPGLLSAKDKNLLTSDFTDSNAVYNIEMTVTQANVISKMLPTNYSLHVDRSIKPKRAVKRAFAVDAKSK